jgi:hypothetical protein
MTAEQLASETVEQMAVANAERLRVEHEARRQAEAAEAAHAARAEAEQAALRATQERLAAEARAEALAASLEEARAALLEQTRAALAAAPSAPDPKPAAKAAKPAPAPEPRIQPAGAPDVVEFHSPSSSAALTVLLGLGALAAAGFAVYQAYLDRLTSTPGIVAVAVTLVLVVIVGRARGVTARVWLEHGVLHVEDLDSQHRFDLTSPNTKVQMVGEPGKRRWKVLFLRKGMAPFEVDADLVDPDEFVRALRPWRPNLSPVE